MSELSPETRAFIDRALAEDAPPPGEKARMRLAVGAAVKATGSASPWAGLTAKLVGGALVAVAAGGLAFALWPAQAPAPMAPVPVAPPPVVAVPAAAPPAPMPEPARPTPHAAPKLLPPRTEVPPAEPAVAEPTPPAPPPYSLADELRLMSGAQQALRQHQPGEAMRLLEEHATRYPTGEMAEERAAIRILVLCEMNEVEDARREADAFFARSPHSPSTPRVRDSCIREESP